MSITTEEKRLLLFHVAGHVFALPLATVDEIVHMAELARPPGLPGFLAGFLNLDGSAIPVVRLDRLFDLPEQDPHLYTQILILKETGFPLAIMVDRVETITGVSPEKIVQVRESHVFNDCVVAEIQVAAYSAHQISIEKILLKKEREAVQAFRNIMKQRLLSLEEEKVG